MKQIIVDVRQEHIDAGKRLKCEECPVALAIAEIIADGICVGVSPWDIYFLAGRSIAMRETPECAQRFIKNFDNRCPVEPSQFPLSIPDWVELKAK